MYLKFYQAFYIFYLLHDKIKLKKCALENLEIEITVIPQNFQSLNINFILRIIQFS